MTLHDVLWEARDRGFLGPGPIEAHIEHAAGFADAVGVPPARVADLGSGGGVPALPLALAWPDSQWLLVESMQRRAAFLRQGVAELALDGRVTVDERRAEEIGRDPAVRMRFDAVTARGFGPPAVTAECAAPLLRLGGVLVVSEPPDDDPGRWPEAGTHLLGFGTVEIVPSTPRFARLTLRDECPPQFPRRVGLPAKRALW